MAPYYDAKTGEERQFIYAIDALEAVEAGCVVTQKKGSAAAPSPAPEPVKEIKMSLLMKIILSLKNLPAKHLVVALLSEHKKRGLNRFCFWIRDLRVPFLYL